jgi:sugar phosphate isomerase/epimerase
MSAETPPISVQLYSLREEAAVDFESVLRRLGDVGFVGVELAGFNGMTTAQFNAVAADSNLVVSSGHVGDASPDALNTALDSLQEVGCDTAVLAFLPPDNFTSLDAVQRSADLLNAAVEISRSRGVALGYHNHFWEFQNSFDGQTAWAALYERLDPDVFAELDIYWATVGGADPIQVIADLGDRLRLLHVKDGPADDPSNPMVAVGSGAVGAEAILRSAPTAQWHIVELDRCATDMFTAVADSYRYLVDSGLSRGRT